MSKRSRLAIFASGGGSNAEEIFKYFNNQPAIEVVLLLSSNPAAHVLVRAQRFGIPTKVLTKNEFGESAIVLGLLEENNVTHIVLAGFLWLIPPYLVRSFQSRIINIHPALLPKFGGKGMYGMKVHEAVKTSGENETGITIHLVNELYDEGRIIFQAKCNVSTTDSPEQIAAKVHQLEYASYPKVIEEWITPQL